MNDMQDLIIQTAERFFADYCTQEVLEAAEKGVWGTDMWRNLEQTGLHLVSIPEAYGGVGGTLSDAITLLRIAGRFAVPLPLAEIMLAGWLLTEAKVELPDMPLTVATAEPGTQLQFTEHTDGWRVTGRIKNGPYARYCNHTIVVDEGQIGLVKLSDDLVTQKTNLAGEPRDTLTFSDTPVERMIGSTISLGTYRARGALLRTAQMVGALEAMLERSVQYASEREQFGRPISKFQAIQQYLAQLAGEVAAAQAAMEAATSAETKSADATAAIAMAKIRVGEATGTATRIAHQVHGAMGYTQEYPLHFFSKRLWSWRDEFGSESYWAAWLGKQVMANGADALWDFVSST